MNRTIFFLAIFLQVGFAYPQSTLSLEDCYTRATEVHPVSGDKVLLESMTLLKLKNHRASYYPLFNLYAQATYQSDVTSLDISVPGIDIPQPSNDQYKVAMEINQVIYDGGLTKNRKQIEKQKLEVSLNQTEVTLYQLKESINSVFFSILLLQEQHKILDLMTEILKERISIAESAVENGVMMESDLLLLRAEQLKLKQQTIELEINRQNGIAVMGEMLEMELEDNTEFEIPEYSIDPSGQITRPEIELFRSQITQLGLTDNLLRTSRRPKVFAFSQVGYGRPGLNMLSDEFDPYYLVGAKISWNPFDWKQNKREREVLQLKQGQVSNQIDAFTRNINIEMESAQSEITKYKRLMELDAEIIEMRIRIVAASASKLDNGIINSADFIADLNSEKQARIDKEIHRMMLHKSQANYHVKKGY